MNYEPSPINANIFNRITIEDAPCFGNAGEPRLPAKGTSILIPQGRKVRSITANPGEKICIGSDYLVEPAGKSVPFLEISTCPVPSPDEIIYNSEEPFPGKLFTKVGTYNFRGYKILVLRLHPVQYILDSLINFHC